MAAIPSSTVMRKETSKKKKTPNRSSQTDGGTTIDACSVDRRAVSTENGRFPLLLKEDKWLPSSQSPATRAISNGFSARNRAQVRSASSKNNTGHNKSSGIKVCLCATLSGVMRVPMCKFPCACSSASTSRAWYNAPLT